MTARPLWTLAAFVALGIAAGYLSPAARPTPPVPTQQASAPPVAPTVSTSRVLLVGPGAQTIVLQRQGRWEVVRVLYDGAITGDLIRIDTEAREVSFPSYPPARWTLHSGGIR